MSVGEFSLILLKCVIYFFRVLEKYKYPVYNPIFDSKKNQTPLESLFYKGFTAVLLCFQV